MNKTQAALNIALEAHKGQTRKIGNIFIPYIMHPIAVANFMLSFQQNEDVVAAALLHDSIEDAEDRDLVRRQITENGLQNSLSIIEELTLPQECLVKDGGHYEADKHDIKYRHIKELMAHGSVEARRVKLGDRILNVQDYINGGDRAYAEKYKHRFLDVCPISFEDRACNELLNILEELS